MKEAVVILTLLGCNHAETQCDYIETDPVKYESVEQCYQHSQSVFEDNARADYPVVMARCDPQGSEVADVSGALPPASTELVEPEAHSTVPLPAEGNDNRHWMRIYPGRALSKVTTPIGDAVSTVAEKSAEATTGTWNAVKRFGARLNPF